MSYFLKSSTPGLNPPTTQRANYAVAAQQVKKVLALHQIHRTIFLAGLKIQKISFLIKYMTDIEMKAMMTAVMTDIMTDMTDMMVTNQDIVMVIEKKEIWIMKIIVLIEGDIDLPVDMTLGNQKGIQIALKVKLKNKWMKLSKIQSTF